jgi:DNA-binding transcriptional MocR family regulator
VLIDTVNWKIVTMTSWTPHLATGKPRYIAIADAIASDLASGKLKLGDRLPPQRQLAWQLGVTLGTVTRAYQEAERRGLLSGEVGRGSYVRSPEPDVPIVVESDPTMLDMQVSSPPRVIRKEEFDAGLRELSNGSNWQSLFDYPSTAGRDSQRAACARWLRPAGVDVFASRIMVSAGAQAALVTCFSTLARPGDRVLIEPLSYPTIQPILRHLGLHARPIEADDQGIVPDSLEQWARSGEAKLLYLVPTLHNPTTVTLSFERRQAITEIARRHGLTIVEDDVFRLLADNPPPTLQSLAPERTYYISSLSKTVAPGLRIGMVVTPEGATDAMVRQQRITGGRAAGMMAELARIWIENGVADGTLSQIKRELAVRRDVLFEAIGHRNPVCSPGAMFAWLPLPSRWVPTEFAALAQARGVKITPGPAFAIDRTAPHQAVRLCIGSPPSADRLRDGLAIIDRLVDEEVAEHYQAMA